ncbi:MAG: hypothetical protein LUH41_01230 [Clostridiales bacterium]|nr:hypothetical protein [Clostridiales bacterium]
MRLTDVEDVKNKMSDGVNALYAIHTAMTKKGFTAESWLPGLLFVIDSLSKECERLDELVNADFAELRKGKDGAR